MPPISDADIDPALLDDLPDNRVTDAMERLMEARAHREPSTATDHRQSSSPEPSEFPNTLSLSMRGTVRSRDDFEASSNGSVPGINVVEFGETVKRQRKLNVESEAELGVFCEMPLAVQHAVTSHSLLLECRDMLRHLSQNTEYKIPSTLMKTLQDYANTFIMSPTIQFYRGASNTAHVLKVMRELKVSLLPAEHETGRCELIKGVIGKAMTERRNHIKTQIKLSLEDESQTRNIAALADACIKNCSAQPTLATYIRLAYIRWIFVNFKGQLSDDRFWKKVDSGMKEVRDKYSTPAEITAAYSVIYEQDQEHYGKPDNHEFPLTLGSTVPSFVNAIQTASART